MYESLVCTTLFAEFQYSYCKLANVFKNTCVLCHKNRVMSKFRTIIYVCRCKCFIVKFLSDSLFLCICLYFSVFLFYGLCLSELRVQWYEYVMLLRMTTL